MKRITRSGFHDDLATLSEQFFGSKICDGVSSRAKYLPNFTADYRKHIKGIVDDGEELAFSVVQLASDNAERCELAVFFLLSHSHLSGMTAERGSPPSRTARVVPALDWVSTGSVLLFIDSNRQFYRKWSDLPSRLQAKASFPVMPCSGSMREQAICRTKRLSGDSGRDGRFLYDGILIRTRAQYALIDDYGPRMLSIGLQRGPDWLFRRVGTPSNCPVGWLADADQGACMPPIYPEEL